MAMAAAHILQDQNDTNGKNNNHGLGVSKEEIQAAIAKAVELRALHAALTQGNSNPTNLKLISTSQFSAHDYPVFTPTYEDEQVSGYNQVPSNNLILSETWAEHGGEAGSGNETIQKDYTKKNSLRKGLPSGYGSIESHICLADDQNSATGSSCTNHIAVHQTSPVTEHLKSVSSCNKCKPATITYESENLSNNGIIVPLTDSHASVQSQPRSRGMILSWFPRLRKKHNHENSPSRTESDQASQICRDLGVLSIETLKKELIEANENRDAALMEVAEMKSSMVDLKQKLECLENYSEEIKKALRQANQAKNSQVIGIGSFSRRGKSTDGNRENLIPVSEEVMVEGFLQIVSETRLSVKHFCKILVRQIEETDSMMNNLNSLLQPYKLSLESKNSKAVLYHLEAIINQALYQDYENCIFQKNGSPKFLDPQRNRQEQFSSFVALRNLSWNEVLRKGTKYYSEEFSKFCDQKMSCLLTRMNWTRPWPEQLLQAFFVAGKCVWLLHLLGFSFDPPLGILRVEENRNFDSHYMDEKFVDRQRCCGFSSVKIMVTPGFYVRDRVVRCKVLCSYKSVA